VWESNPRFFAICCFLLLADLRLGALVFLPVVRDHKGKFIKRGQSSTWRVILHVKKTEEGHQQLKSSFFLHDRVRDYHLLALALSGEWLAILLPAALDESDSHSRKARKT